jgi:hypothetical protein
MTLPFALPDWLPWWVPIVVLVPALLWLLAFLFLPFSVIGTKSRLDVIEARLDEIQGEIRSLALRLPEAGSRSYDLRSYDEMYAAPPRQAPPAEAEALPDRPPIPPPPTDWYERPAAGPTPLPGSRRAGRPDPFAADKLAGPPAEPRIERRPASARRAEPRLNWPER